jgi:aspartate aminotransferase-like enzyme
VTYPLRQHAALDASLAALGLRVALEQYLREGRETVRQRHARAARGRAGAEALGLTLFASDLAIRSDTVTAVRLPEGSPPT